MDIDIIIARQAQKDAIEMAERERLLAQIARTRTAAQHSLLPWMARLGDQVVAWGQKQRARSIRA